ncbi:MAG: HNH endonuclease [Alcaligenaceae bacterium]|nr:MAG: HNH endonuclease [Alcaligenaceae bacterium]
MDVSTISCKETAWLGGRKAGRPPATGSTGTRAGSDLEPRQSSLSASRLPGGKVRALPANEVDHRVPLEQGGSNDLDNLQWLWWAGQVPRGQDPGQSEGAGRLRQKEGSLREPAYMSAQAPRDCRGSLRCLETKLSWFTTVSRRWIVGSGLKADTKQNSPVLLIEHRVPAGE